MKLSIELTENDLRNLVVNHLNRYLPGPGIDAGHVTIEVKSKQNYKSEWEAAEFRARVVRND